jgi:hypothetical protein
MSAEYPHLHSSAQAVIDESAESRIRRIRTDRWISYARAEASLGAIDDLLTFPKRTRMPNLLLVGRTNNGKTMIVESCCERSNVDLGCGTASDPAKPHSLLNINFSDSCSVFPRDGKRGLDQHASHCGSRGGQAI